MILIRDIALDVRAAILNDAADEIMSGIDWEDQGDAYRSLFAVALLRDYAYDLLGKELSRRERALDRMEVTTPGQPMIGAHRPD